MNGGSQANERIPLYVDLDGSLAATDTLYESALVLLKAAPWHVLSLLIWLLTGGKAGLKEQIARRVELPVEQLPWRPAVLALCREARAAGRPLILATGTNHRIAERVAAELGFFDGVLASTGQLNLTGSRKLAAIREHAAGRPFDYVGNEHTDLVIWRAAAGAVVCGSAHLASQAAAVTALRQHIATPGPTIATLLRAIRVHQWAKNLLVILPAVPVAPLLPVAQWLHLLMAFVCFGLCASSVYLLNDMVDLAADRVHARKRHRPLAAGLISVPQAAMLAFVLLAAAMLLAFGVVGWMFGGVLVAYWLLTNAYSFSLKRRVNVDVMTLAMLYTFRLFAGAAAIHVKTSFWILAFSVFLFFCLAVAKRAVELGHLGRRSTAQLESEREPAADSAPSAATLKAAGRGYTVSDLPVLQMQGVAAGQIAVLVLALYINDPSASSHFTRPEALWAICPVLLLWVNRVWFKAARGELNEDPVLFALRDRPSYLLLLVAVLCVLLAF